MKRHLVPTTVLALGLLAAATSAAADARVLLCFPGGPGSTADAQPIVDRFLGALAGPAGWSAATGAYFNDLSECARQFEDQPPTVVMVPLHLYLERRATWKLAPVCTLENQETSGRYHIVGRKGATLEGLKGQALTTGLLADALFFSRVAFAGKVDVAEHFVLKKARSALRAVKEVAKGESAAALVDDAQQRALQGLPMAKDLVTVLSGPELPGAIVAGVGEAPAKLASALAALCRNDAALCRQMRITAFRAVDEKQLSEFEKQLHP